MTIYLTEVVFCVKKTGKGNIKKKIITQAYTTTEVKQLIKKHYEKDSIAPVIFLSKKIGLTDWKLGKAEKEKIILIKD